MEAIGKLRKSVESIQASLEADGSQQLRDSIARSWRLGNRSALSDIPDGLLPGSGIGEAAEEAREQVPQTGAIEALAERLIKDIGDKVKNVLRDALDAYREVVAGASARMLAGGQSRREATQAAWSALVKRGITGFTAKSGRTWRLHSYVEMATRTASARAAVEGQTDRLASIGIGFVYVSDHGQECPLCRPWEGAVLRRADDGPTGEIDIAHTLTEEPVAVTVAGTLAEARAAGLFHPNCRHSVSAYLPGVTQIPEPRGQDPDAYRARMKQRSIERDIRKAKEERAAAFTEDAKRAANAKVRRKQKQLREHLADNPELKRLRYREQAGAGSTPPAGRDDAATGIGPDTQPTLDGGTEQVRPDTRRQEEPEPAEDRTPDQPELKEPEPTEDLTQLSADDLDTRMSELLGAGVDMDSPQVQAVIAEMDRREEAERRREEQAEQRRREREAKEDAQHAEIERLVEDEGMEREEAAAEVLGRSIESIRREQYVAEHRSSQDRRPFREIAREQYKLMIERIYVQAEEQTNGFMLNQQGEAAGIDPMSLFSGPRSRVEKYASEELKRFFDASGRQTFEDFIAEIEAGQPTGEVGRDFNR